MDRLHGDQAIAPLTAQQCILLGLIEVYIYFLFYTITIATILCLNKLKYVLKLSTKWNFIKTIVLKVQKPSVV